MNKLEETKLKLEKMGFEVMLNRHIRSDKTLSDVDLWGRREFNTEDPTDLRVEVYQLKELIPDYHAINLTTHNYYKTTILEVHWYPDNPDFNPKSTKDINLVGQYCKCPTLPDNINE